MKLRQTGSLTRAGRPSQLGKHPDRLQRIVARDAIARTDIAAVDHHIAAGDDAGKVQFLGGFQCQALDFFLLRVLGRAHTDTGQRNLRVDRLQPRDQTGLGVRAARRCHQLINSQAAIIGLRHQAEGAVDISQRTGGIRAAARKM